MATAKPARRVFSPLDEELGLLAGPFTPCLVEGLVRLGTWMPFGQASKGIDYFLKVSVSEATARRKTEAAGQAHVEVQTAKVEALEARPPESPRDEPKGPARQLFSADGAMVPLVGKRWGEVKTLVIGTIGAPKQRDGEQEVHTEELSYFSRMTDHETFGRLSTVETYRRGTATAELVCAVNDGAEWEQRLVDLQRPDAVRILDFGHSAEHLAAVAQAIHGIGTEAAQAWLKAECHELRHGDPEKVLGDLRRLRDELAEGLSGVESGIEVSRTETLEVVRSNLEYFEKRKAQIRYAEFEAKGYPIGSGAVESGNKLVVEARLKGSGMHWEDSHVDPMVGLRTVACSDRWDEAWPEIERRLRTGVTERADTRRASRRARRREANGAGNPPEGVPEHVAEAKAVAVSEVPMLADGLPQGGLGQVSEAVADAPRCTHTNPPVDRPAQPTAVKPHRPAANHPWRHMPIGRQRQR
jgi:hypothetical protein